jgi:hypothetical protein
MYIPEIGRWNSNDPYSDFFEITTPYAYAFNNPMIFVDPTGKENIIYLVLAGDFDKKKAEEIAANATAILQNLGLETQVRVYDSESLGKFDADKLDETDNWAVLGNDRKEVSETTKDLNKNENYDSEIDRWEQRERGQGNPETSNSGKGERPNSAKGIVVDYNDPIIKKDKDFSASLAIIHGAGHSAEKIKELRKYHPRGESHTSAGIMQDGTNINNDYYQRGGSDVITRKATNLRYIDAMQDRYKTNAAKDNAFNGQVRQAVSKSATKN